jgi:elongation factor 1 alpha-like protein
MPWLHTPLDRQTTFIAPLYPRGGLLGGSSGGAPKMSKLQALAAARKKKAQEQKSSGSTGVETPMAKLTLDSSKSADQKAGSSRGFPQRKRKDSNPHEKVPTPIEREFSKEESQDTPMETPPLDQAKPSAFANIMFSTPSKPSSKPDSFFTLPYNATPVTNTDPFAGPSPDDVVIAAQSKGSTTSASKK